MQKGINENNDLDQWGYVIFKEQNLKSN
jgi:hypothetical protein